MWQFFNEVFNTAGLIPHGYCLLWNSPLLWTLAASDSIIAISYFSISLAIWYFAKKRSDVSQKELFLLFGLFIIACGTTHFYDVLIIWQPSYWGHALTKALTAVFSFGTAVAVWVVMPAALRVPLAQELERARRELEQANAELEHRVQQRTLELQNANTSLKSALLEANRFRDALDHIPTCIYMKNLQHRYVYANKATLEFFKCSAEELYGYDGSRFFPPDTFTRLHDANERILKKGESTAEEMEIESINGRRYIYLEVKTPIYDDVEQKRIWGMCGISTDITERKRLESEVLAGREKLVSAMNSMSDAVFISDSEGKLVDFNEAFATFHKFKNKEECIRTLEEYVQFIEIYYPSGELVPLEQWAVPRALRGKKGSNVEFKLLRKDTGEAWFGSFNFAPIRNQEGVIIGSVVTGRDITERMRVEAALRSSENRFSILFNKASLPAALTRLPEHVFVDVNEAWQQLFGYTKEEVIGRTAFELGINHDLSMIYKISQRKPVRNLEQTLFSKSGKAIIVFININRIEIDGQDYAITSLQDISEQKQALARLDASEKEFRLLAEAMPQIVWITRADGWNIYFNKQWVDYTGLTLEESYGHGWIKPFHPDDRQRARDVWQNAVGNNATYSLECRLRRADGVYRWWLIRGVPVPDNGGKVIKWFGTCTDIDELKRNQESLQLADMVYQASNQGIMVTDADGIIIAVNPSFTRITGYESDEIIGKNPRILNSGCQDKDFFKLMWESLNTSGQWQGEILNRRKNGEIYAEFLTINNINSKDGSVHRRVGIFSDISDKKKSEEVIWRQANFDALTGLPNRYMVYDRLELEIRKAHRDGKPIALMFVDLDRFKEINDTLGHAEGDALLKAAAQRMVSCVRETDTVGRPGGDEFTITMNEFDDILSVERVANSVLAKLSQPYQLGEELIYISASIGITLYPDDAKDVATLFKFADQAMYEAKHQGRNRFSYYTHVMQDIANKRMRLINDLHKALAESQLRVYYQPIVDLVNNEIYKAEALVRWQHPAHGLISPADFIPIAEETGLILNIGDWVFCQAAAQVARCRANYHPEFQISINNSPVQFRIDQNDHTSWVIGHLEMLQLPGHCIVIEITESILMETKDEKSSQLLAFRDNGIQVALDDFGTGYSSLSYLKKFDIDYIKIDQSFVRNLEPDSSDLALCEAIIVMAHKLGIKVIAEGVETQVQRDLLKEAGCDYGQGYLWSRPVPADEFERLL